MRGGQWRAVSFTWSVVWSAVGGQLYLDRGVVSSKRSVLRGFCMVNGKWSVTSRLRCGQ